MFNLEAHLADHEIAHPMEVGFGAVSEHNSIDAVSVVPVAAHQEDIRQLLRVYGEHASIDNWQTFVYLNAPLHDVNSPHLRRNVDIMERLTASGALPENFTWGLRLYDWGSADGDFGMGRIRRDGWRYALEALERSKVTEDTIGFSHDADMVALSSNYFKKATKLAQDAPAHFYHTPTYWGIDELRPNDRPLPALNRLATYMGITEVAFQSATRINHIWDCAAGFRLGSYVASGGYQESVRHTETEPLITNLRGQESVMPLVRRLDGTFLVTSMRRYIERAARGESPFAAVDPSIVATDELRGGSSSLETAEEKTRVNFTEWCNEADDNNVREVIALFSESDGHENVAVRVDYYDQLVNYGRQLMKQAGAKLSVAPAGALPHAIRVIQRVDGHARTLLDVPVLG